MSKKKETFSSLNKPRFVYLDKFCKYQIQTDKMLGDLEDVQMKHVKYIGQLQKTLKSLQKSVAVSIIIAGIASIIATVAMIY